MKGFVEKSLGLLHFLESLKAVCLGSVHIPKIGPIPFKMIEQKLVQRGETYIKVYTCKAS